MPRFAANLTMMFNERPLLAGVARLLRARGFSRFLVAGGETSGAVVNGLGVSAMLIGPEIDPGVPWTVSVGMAPQLRWRSNQGGQVTICSSVDWKPRDTVQRHRAACGKPVAGEGPIPTRPCPGRPSRRVVAGRRAVGSRQD